MDQNAQVIAIVTELQTSQKTLANDLSVIVADIAAAKNAGTPVTTDTLTALQGVADAFKANVDNIDAAINPAQETESTSSTTEDENTTGSGTQSTDAGAGTDANAGAATTEGEQP